MSRVRNVMGSNVNIAMPPPSQPPRPRARRGQETVSLDGISISSSWDPSLHGSGRRAYAESSLSELAQYQTKTTENARSCALRRGTLRLACSRRLRLGNTPSTKKKSSVGVSDKVDFDLPPPAPGRSEATLRVRRATSPRRDDDGTGASRARASRVHARGGQEDLGNSCYGGEFTSVCSGGVDTCPCPCPSSYSPRRGDRGRAVLAPDLPGGIGARDDRTRLRGAVRGHIRAHQAGAPRRTRPSTWRPSVSYTNHSSTSSTGKTRIFPGLRLRMPTGTYERSATSRYCTHSGARRRAVALQRHDGGRLEADDDLGGSTGLVPRPGRQARLSRRSRRSRRHPPRVRGRARGRTRLVAGGRRAGGRNTAAGAARVPRITFTSAALAGTPPSFYRRGGTPCSVRGRGTRPLSRPDAGTRRRRTRQSCGRVTRLGASVPSR